MTRMGDSISSSGASRLAPSPSPEFAKLKCDEGWALRARKRLCAAADRRILHLLNISALNTSKGCVGLLHSRIPKLSGVRTLLNEA